MGPAGTVVLVEGASDERALVAVAERRGIDLVAAGVEVVAMGGVTNVRRYLRENAHRRFAGLCDAGEAPFVARVLGVAVEQLEDAGFFVCVADLEDELIRGLGAAAVERVVEEEGDLRSLRAMQKQPAQRDRTLEQQLHRFMGTHSGRKLRYPPLLVGALATDAIPRPLDRVLRHALLV